MRHASFLKRGSPCGRDAELLDLADSPFHENSISILDGSEKWKARIIELWSPIDNKIFTSPQRA
jgi:hypothetical protein